MSVSTTASLLCPQGEPTTHVRQWQERTVVDLGFVGNHQSSCRSADRFCRSDGRRHTANLQIFRSPPMGHSYTQELAARYSISFDRIVETLTARQVIDPRIVAL
jgi:hypothetical protein